jgi:redox-sensitive bicupin YhaK (pirin superfamily)
MLELVIDQRRRDLGGFEVGRVLPFPRRRMVGPFIFFDHLGPENLAAGIQKSVDVRPHPHIGLSTVTYLFDGEIMHRDSVGSELAIRPGEVNWMVAGRGITHSERFEKARLQGDALHGIQSWVALPTRDEETTPEFAHYDHLYQPGQMLVFAKGTDAVVTAMEPTAVMALGGESVGERHIEWNFVSSSKERIEQAKADWRAGRMKLPDLDHQEFIPLPETPPAPPSSPL